MHVVAILPKAALENITHTKLASYLLDIDGFPLVSEARIARDDEQRLEPRQRCDDVLDHPISEKLLLRIAAQVLKWQYCDGGLVGEREGFWVAGRSLCRS